MATDREITRSNWSAVPSGLPEQRRPSTVGGPSSCSGPDPCDVVIRTLKAHNVRRQLKRDRVLFAYPYSTLLFPFRRCLDRWTWGHLGTFIARSRQVHTWLRGDEAVALAHASYALRPDATIVIVGAFLGGSTVLLAGARKVHGSGVCHVIDSFDASGDAFSAPVYQEIAAAFPAGLRAAFDATMARSGLSDWVRVHQGRAEDVAPSWQLPIDMLVLNADHSVKGARALYESWSPFVRPGGLVVVCNVAPRRYAPDHDGNRRIWETDVLPPKYSESWIVGSTGFAVKLT